MCYTNKTLGIYYIYTYAKLVYRIPLGELAKVTTSGCMK